MANNSDCDDADGNVHPGQAGFFSTPSHGTGTYDYNCDGTRSPQYGVYAGASCGYCDSSGSSCAYGTCGAVGDQATLTCGQSFFCGGFLASLVVQPMSVDNLLPQPVCYSYCGGVSAGFTQNVDCGQTATYTVCGTCATASTYSTAGTSMGSRAQGCN